MDFPLFHLDFLGNRLLIAIIAIVHVYMSHALAVGMVPLVTLMEWKGWRDRDAAWDELARRTLFVCFILTTSVGALTGVGIWFSTSLVNPAAIGSLIRIFFWAWFFEWILFFVEVALILAWFLSWRPLASRKGLHVGIGVFLSVFSWGTMAVIAAILGFMMDPGGWTEQRSLWTGILNPVYLPQLAFRTGMAMVAAGFFAMFLAFFFTRRDPGLRAKAVRGLSGWVLLWLPVGAAGALWYRAVVPGWMAENYPVALMSQNFVHWTGTLLTILAAMAAVGAVVALWGLLLPRRLPRVALLVPFVLAIVLMGYFERVREFVRKPYIITDYMYANGLVVDAYPLLQNEGLLRHAAYVPDRAITDANRRDQGREVFRLACTRCHTTTGMNGVVAKLRGMYGDRPWDREAVKGYVQTMHNPRPFMPPFPGNDPEAGALADYLVSLQQYPESLSGAQTAGVALPAPAAEE